VLFVFKLKTMRYIKIKNKGLIEPEALHLVGASTKRSDSRKIGQFGSGNKYAMAYFLRNDYELIVYSGTKEIKITTEKSNFRDHDFNVVYINGQKTSITTEMGKDWEFWQALREVYCNAIDEGGFSMDFVSNVDPYPEETHFYIRTSDKAVEFMNNFDNYFATNKEVLFECKQGRILKKSGDTVNIYRKGIRCYETKKESVYDYDFDNISIDENRLVNYFWEVEQKMWGLIFQCDNEEVIMQVLHNCGDSNFLEGALSDISTINSSNMSDMFRKCIQSTKLAPKGYAGLLKPDEVHQHVILPTKIFNSVRGTIDDEVVGDNFKVTRKGAFFREVENNKLQEETLRKAIDFLNECSFQIPYEIRIAVFDEKKVLGTADPKNKLIYISEVCLSMGVNEVVNTIIEEFIHLKHDVADETRAFQTAAITELIDYMKMKNAYSI